MSNTKKRLKKSSLLIGNETLLHSLSLFPPSLPPSLPTLSFSLCLCLFAHTLNKQV